MGLSSNLERSRLVTAWLLAVAVCVVAILVVGGMTRLTGSGLSITNWRPIAGVLPPLNRAAWIAEFARYREIPQYRLENPGMSLAAFQGIYWWEWAHRLFARLVGVMFIVPFVVLLGLRRVPPRLVWRCLLIFALGGVQGMVGWWMVASGLSVRTSVAPERLAIHLGLALLLISACVWTAYEAWSGRRRSLSPPPGPWSWAGPAIAALVYLQCLMGALVSGGRAGLIDGDWPTMGGRFFPEGYRLPTGSWLASVLHSAPAVQFNHRMVAYTVFLASLAFLVAARTAPSTAAIRRWSHALAGAVFLQMALGVATLWAGDPIWLGALHQLGAVGVLTAALTLAWNSRRA